MVPRLLLCAADQDHLSQPRFELCRGVENTSYRCGNLVGVGFAFGDTQHAFDVEGGCVVDGFRQTHPQCGVLSLHSVKCQQRAEILVLVVEVFGVLYGHLPPDA